MIKDLLVQSRSYRRFVGGTRVSREVLRELVDLTRYAPSGGNLQSLKYLLVDEPAECAKVFPLLSWARYLKDWKGPAESERPPAYVVILGDSRIAKEHRLDAGIAAQSFLLGAVERGLGGCMMTSVNREELRKIFGIPTELDIVLVIALGVPAEKAVVEQVDVKGDIKYWRDADGVHHVPKRPLEEILLTLAKG